MKENSESFVRRLLKDQRGQILPIVGFFMIGLLGMIAFVVDMGDIFYSYQELQSSTDAAALAGVQSLPATTATTVANSYSSISGGKNVSSNLSTVTMVSGYPKLLCLSTLTGEGIPCVAPATANAIQVKQTVAVPMYFAGLFGTTSVSLTSTATAAMRGAVTSPYNVVILLDTTQSMNDTDNDSNCSTTRIICATSGIQTLLSDLSPCASSETTCPTNGSNSVDNVALFTFPNLSSSSQATDDYDCSSSTPSITTYSFPSTTATTYAPASNAATYQVLAFGNDYRTSDTSTTLSTNSNLSKAVGAKSGCTGVAAPGGEGTYYAGAIYAAQAALVAEAKANPGSQNVLILISDGDASSSSSQMTGASTTTGTYPSTKNECAQAVTAGKAATTAGTQVYAIAYGAEASGCSTDSPSITPCQTMEGIASSAAYFFSDYNATGGDNTCVSASQPTTNLDQIFTEIAANFTVARLIPNNTP